jgi:hypothetical protein
VFVLILQALTAVTFMLYILITDLELTFDKWGVLITAIISALFVFYGIILLRRSKLEAYKQFKTAVLVLILLTQFFLFYSAQFHALIALIFNLMILFMVNYVIKLEEEKTKERTVASLSEEGK